SWLMGVGAAAIYNLMEDAATAEISRTQIWQWLKNEAVLSDDRTLTRNMILQWEREEMDNIEKYVGEERFKNGKFNLAKELFNELIFSENFEEFLTLKAYPFI
ncbi:MAG: malate synthase A, partial [Chryseobacterium artocarpi]